VELWLLVAVGLMQLSAFCWAAVVAPVQVASARTALGWLSAVLGVGVFVASACGVGFVVQRLVQR
jgi:hypothetical protein